MITVTGRGWYHLLDKPSLLILDKEDDSGVIKTTYRFDPYHKKGEISFVSTGRIGIDGKIMSGRFRMYETIDEAQFADGTHLELCEGAGKWNCYVLPRGLPNEQEQQKEYFSTNKCVTKCCCDKN